MLAREEDVEAGALRAQGWSISAIARHLGHDPKTVRYYLNGERTPGVRRRSGEDPFERFEPYTCQRLKDDPHLQLATLLREVQALGFSGSYQTLTRQVRVRSLRPHCEACSAAKGRATTEITHEPGAETQFDWLELPEAPWGGTAIVLVGALAHSAKFRGSFSEAKDTAHLVAAMDQVLRRLGGLTKRVRIDAIEGGVIPGTRRLVPAFADACRHYGVGVDLCPARRGNRKGVVEKANDYLAQAWWRTADVESPEQAQASLDRFCERVADARPRGHATVAELAAAERLRAVPRMPYSRRGPGPSEGELGSPGLFRGQPLLGAAGVRRRDGDRVAPSRGAAPSDPLEQGRGDRLPPAAASGLRGPRSPRGTPCGSGAHRACRVHHGPAVPPQGQPPAVAGRQGTCRGAFRRRGAADPARGGRPFPLRGADAPCPMRPSTSVCAPTWPT